MRIAAGPERQIVAGQVRVVALPRDTHGVPREALLLRDAEGHLRAYLNRCQHLPIPLDSGGRRFLTLDGQHLQCRTHGARYRLDDGFCIDGPCAGRVLEPIALEFEGALVYIVVDG